MSKQRAWITSIEAAIILNTTPDKINYWGRKGFFGKRKMLTKGCLYYRKRVEEAKASWDKMELSKIRKSKGV